MAIRILPSRNEADLPVDGAKTEAISVWVSNRWESTTGDGQPRARELLFVPNEIWTRILSFLPTVQSLARISLVSKQLHACAEQVITPVLQNDIGRDAFPEALAALESSKVGTMDPKVFFFSQEAPKCVAEFSGKYMAHRASPPAKMPLGDIRAMLTLHRSVKHLANKFITFAIDKLYWESKRWHQPLSQAPFIPVSSLEFARFQRTLYRFEVYCNIWKEPKEVRFFGQAIAAQIEHFFRWLSPWELEQIVALKDFLTAEIIRPRLSHALKHNPSFEPMSSASQLWSWFQYQHRLLSYGLNFLYRADTGPPDSFEQLVSQLPPDQYGLPYAAISLYIWPNNAFNQVLNNSHDGQSPAPRADQPTYGTMTAEQYSAAVRASLVTEDQNEGPEMAWRWAYKGFGTDVICNDVRMVNARRFAYVFWDWRRIREIRFLDRENDGSFWKWMWSGYRLPEYSWGDNAWQIQRTARGSPPMSEDGSNASTASAALVWY